MLISNNTPLVGDTLHSKLHVRHARSLEAQLPFLAVLGSRESPATAARCSPKNPKISDQTLKKCTTSVPSSLFATHPLLTPRYPAQQLLYFRSHILPSALLQPVSQAASSRRPINLPLCPSKAYTLAAGAVSQIRWRVLLAPQPWPS